MEEIAGSVISRELIIPGFKAYELTGRKGDSITFTSDVDIPHEKTPMLLICVEGEIDVPRFTLKEGHEPVIDIPIHPVFKVGYNNVEEPFDYLSGVYTSNVISDTFKYYCISREDKKHPDATIVRLKAGDEFTVTVGNSLFIADGVIVTSKNVTVGGPCVLKSVNNDITFICNTDLFAAVIKN